MPIRALISMVFNNFYYDSPLYISMPFIPVCSVARS